MWASVTFESGWQVWNGVCHHCYHLEWREFKKDYQSALCLKSPEERRQEIHALNLRFCDTIASQCRREVVKMYRVDNHAAEVCRECK